MKIDAILFFGCLLAFGAARADLLDDVAAADRAADGIVATIGSEAELKARQQAWRAAWLKGIGGLPERTPLNAQEGPVVVCDGFTLQNILFESQPGVYVVGHLALPTSPSFKPPYPAVLMANGHSNESVLAPRYAAHLAMMARAGFAAFSWDPISQGERRQSKPECDYTDNCSTEHTRLGFRGWLVGWNFARFLVWDGMRALDYLETRKDVDCSKVGICGTSGGGTQSAYLQALDPRIKVAFPNCFVSSIRAVFAERGCHDAEQFFWKQLNVGVNHAAILAMGCPRVALATGSRWKDYFPQKGAEETFAVYAELCGRMGGAGLSGIGPYRVSDAGRSVIGPYQVSDAGRPGVGPYRAGEPPPPPPFSTSSPPPPPFSTFSPWHFHCDGPHGLPLPTRQAQVDWMTHCIKGGPKPKPLADYWALSTGDHSGTNDPATVAALPFPKDAAYFTATHQVRDLKGFRSLYDIIAERAREFAKRRADVHRGADAQREIVRRRAGIRPLAKLVGGPLGDRPLPGVGRGPHTSSDRLRGSLRSGDTGDRPLPGVGRGPLGDRPLPAMKPFDHPKFGWWYLKGAYGCRRENEAAMLATLGRSVVGRDAERIILDAVAEIRKLHPEVTLEDLLTSDFTMRQPTNLGRDGLRPVRGRDRARPSHAETPALQQPSLQKADRRNGGCRFQIPLRATGWDCIAAAHAYAAEPQLFSTVEFTNPPPSWTEMVTNPDPKNDSYAIAVWGALEEYDWTDLVGGEAISKPRSARDSRAHPVRHCARVSRALRLSPRSAEIHSGVKTPCK